METFEDAANKLKPPKRIPIEELRQLTLESNRDEWIRQREMYNEKRPTQEEIDAYTLTNETKLEKIHMKRYVRYHIMQPKPMMIMKIPEGLIA